MEFPYDDWHRRLDEGRGNEGTSDDGGGTTSGETGSAEIIRRTLRAYGTFYGVALLLFEILRRRFPNMYNIRRWVEEHKCELAHENYDQYFSWLWKVYMVPEMDIFEQCGFDALCFIRALRFCRNLAVVGVINALWLLPVYRTAKAYEETANVTDDLDKFTLANLGSASNRFAATVLAAYIMAFATMYLLGKEFKWYKQWRHHYLSQRTANNYAVYVYGIPKEYRTSYDLLTYFQQCSSESAVLEAHVTMDTPELEKLQAERENIVHRLEHIRGLEKRKKKVSFARNGLLLTEKDELIRTYEARLEELNLEIPRRIRATKAVNDKFRSRMTKLKHSKDLVHGLDLKALEENSVMESDIVPSDSTSDLLVTKISTETEIMEESPVALKSQEIEEEEDSDNDSDQLPEDRAEDREFLSILVPGAEDLLHSTSGRNYSATSDYYDAQQSADKIVSSEEAQDQSSSSAFDDITDLEAQTFDAQVIYVREDSGSIGSSLDRRSDADFSRRELELGTKNPSSSTQGSSVSRRLGGKNISRSSQGSSRRGSTGNMGSRAISTVIRGAEAASGGISKGTKIAGETLKKGSKMTKDTLAKTGKAATAAIASGSKTATSTMKKAAKDMKVDKLIKQAGKVVPIVLNRGEGQPRPGAFVVFTNLYAVQTALQMIHHSEPSTMEVQEAPAPGDIFWRNVGMQPRKRNLGRLYSFAATVVLCFFWTIPTSFIASLTSVSSVKEELPKLGNMLEEQPWLEGLFLQLAPLLLLFLNEVLLPEILKFFATWEGHVSAAVLEASLFLKLSAFMIIQTFFVSAISGSLMDEISNLLKNPEEIINLLATSLPSQSSYFIQIMFAATFLLQGIEMLRIYPLGCALLRRFVGPNATKKESRKAWMYIFTLEDPPPFWMAETFAQVQILFIVVLLVYAPIAPFTACALLFCFFLMEAGYRFQFYHNYPRAYDTGGKLFYTFFQYVLASLLIAEFTLVGLLALKQSKYAGPAIFPLIIVTILYILYINNRYLRVLKVLPSRQCIEIDHANAKAGRTDFSFCHDEFLQPSLKRYTLVPEYEEDEKLQETDPQRTMSES